MKLPKIIEVDDYHEFNYLKKQFGAGIKVKEIGCDGYYFGIAYEGKLSNPKNKKLYEKLLKRAEESEEFWEVKQGERF